MPLSRKYSHVQPATRQEPASAPDPTRWRRNDGVFHRTLLFEHLTNCATVERFWADRDIDAVQLDLLVGWRVERLLVRMVSSATRSLPSGGRDDQLALAAADRISESIALSPSPSARAPTCAE